MKLNLNNISNLLLAGPIEFSVTKHSQVYLDQLCDRIPSLTSHHSNSDHPKVSNPDHIFRKGLVIQVIDIQPYDNEISRWRVLASNGKIKFWIFPRDLRERFTLV